MTPPHRILLVDDHELVRAMLAQHLDAESDIEVLGQTDNGSEAVAIAERSKPDVAILDIDIPGADSFELGRILRDKCPGIRIIFLSGYLKDQFISRALSMNADAYLTKNESPSRVVDAVRSVIAGERVFSSEVRSRINRFACERPYRERSPLELLTARELEVLGHVARAMSKKEIASTLGLSVKTIDHHVHHVMNKLKIHDRVELTRFAIREGLVNP